MFSRKMLLQSVTFMAFILIACGCQSMKVNVDTLASNTVNLGEMKQFSITPVNRDHPRLERELLAIARKELESRGLQYVNSDGDFVLAIHFYTGLFEKYVPPRKFRTRSLTSDRAGTRNRPAVPGDRVTEADRLRRDVRRSVTRYEGYTDTLYYQNIQVYFVQQVQPEAVEVIWQGKIDGRNKRSDILAVAPSMFAELFDEFPKRSAKTSNRRIKIQ